jgi:hypothetical protein
MRARKRREVNIFTMSFLDVMFCGFGAVVLLVMIVNANIVQNRQEVRRDLRAEVNRLQQEVLDETRTLARLRNTLERTERDNVEAQGLSQQLLTELTTVESSLESLRNSTLANRAHVNELKSDLKALDAEKKRLQELARKNATARGENLRRVTGAGDRQYLTGLKVGGRRVVILLDVSSSMLADTVVNIIRRRNLSVAEKLRSRKWRQALAIADWVTAQIPSASRFQIYLFNDRVRALVDGTEGRWLRLADAARVNAALDSLRQVVPDKGTSLYNAFVALGALEPKPDNIYLITDGLPTQARKRPWGGTVSPGRRFSYFQQAVEQLPRGIPVNIILLPMEGDPEAASAFWKLAARTDGSLLSPARDWP